MRYAATFFWTLLLIIEWPIDIIIKIFQVVDDGVKDLAKALETIKNKRSEPDIGVK